MRLRSQGKPEEQELGEMVNESATPVVSVGAIAFSFLRWMSRAVMYCVGLVMMLALVAALAVLAATMTLAVAVPARSPGREAGAEES